MAFGFGVLRLSPRAFWSMTPRELDAAMRGNSGDVGSANAAPAPSRNDLATLMQRFPDISSN